MEVNDAGRCGRWPGSGWGEGEGLRRASSAQEGLRCALASAEALGEAGWLRRSRAFATPKRLSPRRSSSFTAACNP
jgi:hypothetical protein